MTDSTDTAENRSRKNFFKRYRFLLAILLALGVWSFLMLGPASWFEKIASKRWDLKGAWLFENQQQDVLLVHLYSMPRGKGRLFTRIMTFDPANGKQLGLYLVDSNPKIFGVNNELVWVREFGLGMVKDKRDFALGLPGLNLVYDIPAILEKEGISEEPTQQLDVDQESGLVHILTQEQSWWIYDPDSRTLSERGDRPHPFIRSIWDRKLCRGASKPPRLLGEELLLDAVYVCDMRSDELLDPSDSDRLLAHQTLQDEKGKLMLTRLTASGEKAWTLHESDWAGRNRGKDVNGFRVEWSTRYQDLVILALPQDDANGDFYLLAIHPDSGEIAWQQHYD